MLLLVLAGLSSIRPPSTSIWPSSTSTVVLMDRLLVIRPVVWLSLATLDASCSMSSWTVSPSLICGFTLRINPTSWRSMV